MLKRSRTTSDANALAANVVSLATEMDGKNPAAVALGRLGGLKGGKARARSLTRQERHDIAVSAAKARWGKNKRNH